MGKDYRAGPIRKQKGMRRGGQRGGKAYRQEYRN